MSTKLAGWSLFYSVACLMGTALSMWAQNSGPLLLAGVISFSSLFYVYGLGGYSQRLFQGANLLTLSRLLLTLSLFSVPFLPNADYLILLISLFILIADGFDGWLARRRNEATEFGEYFDKETDAFFLLTLCVLAYWQNKVGMWILLPGLLRYVFVIFMAAVKPKEGKEYRSRWARVIYVVMISCLLGVFVLPGWLYTPAITLATTALILSFAHYFKWVVIQKYATQITSHWLIILGGFLLLNSLLLLPSFVTNLSTSTFLPIPGLKNPAEISYWTRGWYDHFLYYFIRRPNQDIFRICVDLVGLLSIMYAVNKPIFTRRVIGPLFIALLIYEMYDALVYSFFHRSGIVIEDAQYWLNLFYILRDALSPEQAPIFIAAATALILFLWILPGLLNRIASALHSIQSRTILSITTVAFWSVSLFFWFWFGAANSDPTLRSIIGKVGVNVSDSFELQRTIAANKSQPVDPVYSTFASTELRSTPDIYLFLIESYGSIVNEDPNLSSLHQERIHLLETTLHDDGWYIASMESKAPVSGGLSWLSMSSTLAGLYIDNKAQYTSFLNHIDSYPHLVSFLKNRGYTTLTIQPPNRPRPGLPLINPFRFDHAVYFQELKYSGDPYGVWIIPDQYSLEFTQETYLKDVDTPIFLFFETASTHAPWVAPPPLVDDWRMLNQKLPQPTVDNRSDPPISLFQKIKNSYNNRFYKEIPHTYKTYYETISYDLEVISRFIQKHTKPNSLIILLGDHQPPLLASSTFNTPMHIITKDSTLYHQLESFGFSPGLSLEAGPTSTQTHAGLYSMLIDLLAVPQDSLQELPSSRYRPNGIPPSILP